MTFLHLGEVHYVRDPEPALAELFAEPYVAHRDLPANAVDTRFERDGNHLWLSPDRHRAYIGTRDDVEVWPRSIERPECA